MAKAKIVILKGLCGCLETIVPAAGQAGGAEQILLVSFSEKSARFNQEPKHNNLKAQQKYLQHMHFLLILHTTCFMQGRRISCLQEAQFCSLFFRKKVPPHSEKCPLQFSSSFELENTLIWLQWDKSSVGHAWLGWMLVEKTSLQPPVGCWVLLWTFSSLRIGPYFCICTALSTFCPCGSMELQTLPKTQEFF